MNSSEKLISIPYNTRVGYLMVGGYEGPTHCRITCDCGYQESLPLVKVSKLIREGKGCQTAACEARPLVDRLWENPALCLRFQWFCFTAFYGEEIPSRWAGRMDDLYQINFDTGFSNLLEDLFKGKPPKELCWVDRKDNDFPFVVGNIRFGKKPNTMLSRVFDTPVDLGAGSKTVTQVADLVGQDPDAVLLKAYKRGTFEDILQELMLNE